MQTLMALADANSFYCSCEAVFNPRLRHQPMIVASNNDGCCVARNAAAKALGIPMGVPLFKIQDLLKAHRVQVFSSNYVLYGDLSSRVMEVLGMFTPEQEVYSIDESFLRIPDCVHGEAVAYGQKMRATVLQWTGIPVSIGLGPSKTLAKIASHIAKRDPHDGGVFDLSDPGITESVLATVPVEEIWGIGRRYTQWLQGQGIKTAEQFRNAAEGVICSKMGVVGVRIQLELRGVSCLPLELVPPAKQETGVSRSFGKPIMVLAELQEAISAYGARAAEKLRDQGQVAAAMVVYARTSPYASGYYRQSVTVQFEVATQDTFTIVGAARRAAAAIFQPGLKFKKAGVLMVGLSPEGQVQEHLWAETGDREQQQRLMAVMDQINAQFGRGAIRIAATGLGQRWKMQSQWRSPCYTTRWEELPVAVC